MSELTGATATYGTALRSMFQMLELNTAVLATQPLTGTYTLQPELMSYYSIDANTINDSTTSAGLLVRDRGSFYLSDQTTIAYLVFAMTGTPSSTKIQAMSRYMYDSVTGTFVQDVS